MRKFRLIRDGYPLGFVKGNIYDESSRPFGESRTVRYFAEKYPGDWEEVFEVPDHITERGKANELSIHQTTLGYYAGLAMQALISNGQDVDTRWCVGVAKELIKQLENETNNF